MRIRLTGIKDLCGRSPIPAIKELRAASHYGLKESKDIVDFFRHGSPVPYCSLEFEIVGGYDLSGFRDYFHYEEVEEVTVSMSGLGVSLKSEEEEVISVSSSSFPANGIGIGHKEMAVRHLSEYAKELLEGRKWDEAQILCNMLSILKTVDVQGV